MPPDERDMDKALEGVDEKVQRLEEELGADEALDLLEEAVTAVEDLGERLEETGS